MQLCESLTHNKTGIVARHHLRALLPLQVKALEAAEAARRKEAAKAADRLKQKGTLDKQRAERAKVCCMCTSYCSPVRSIASYLCVISALQTLMVDCMAKNAVAPSSIMLLYTCLAYAGDPCQQNMSLFR